jgi:molybdenum cofactor cytidylyltransferase
MDSTLNISALIMAAGLSSRMQGNNKLLLDWKGKPILHHTIKNIVSAGFREVLLVVGNHEKEIRKIADVFKEEINILFNPYFESGLTSSIQCGIQAASDQTKGFMICLGDMFLINQIEFKQLAQFHITQELNDQVITLPKVGQKIGNPVIFAECYREQILKNSDTQGCKFIVQANAAKVKYFESLSKHFLTDLDTLEDYEQLKKSAL